MLGGGEKPNVIEMFALLFLGDFKLLREEEKRRKAEDGGEGRAKRKDGRTVKLGYTVGPKCKICSQGATLIFIEKSLEPDRTENQTHFAQLYNYLQSSC